MQLYLVRNLVNGKGYIGITKQKLYRRWSAHVTRAIKGQGFVFAKALRKYGVKNFTLTVLAEASTYDELKQLEIEAIKQYDTFIANGRGYNLTTGGEGTPGVKPSAELCQRRSETRKKNGYRPSAESLKRMSETKKQHPQVYSEARRAAISQRMRTMPRTPEHRQHMSESLRGRALSAEARQKMSEAKMGKTPWNKGIPASEASIQRLIEANTGRTPWNKGRKASVEECAQIAERSLKAPNPLRKPIIFQGMTYPSIMGAARETGIGVDRIRWALKTGRATYVNLEDTPGYGS